MGQNYVTALHFYEDPVGDAWLTETGDDTASRP